MNIDRNVGRVLIVPLAARACWAAFCAALYPIRLPVGVGQRSEWLMAAMREGGKGIDHRELSPSSPDTLAECVEMLSCLAFDVDTG